MSVLNNLRDEMEKKFITSFHKNEMNELSLGL